MKFLIAGFGSIGRRHLNNLHALGEEDILLYRTHRSTLAEEGSEGIPVETSLEAALAHHPDAVIISNPTALHLRAMNMLFEGLKDKGAIVIVPSSAVDTMNLGGLSGMTALAQNVAPGKLNPGA